MTLQSYNGLWYESKVIGEKQNRGTWCENMSFSEHYFEYQHYSIRKLFTLLKTIKLTEYFNILDIARKEAKIILKHWQKKVKKGWLFNY
jgi:hypothetical protein